MAGWSGFTDDDLRKMRQHSQADEPAAANKKANIRRQQLQQQAKATRSPRLNINPEATSERENVTDRMKLSAKSTPHDGSREGNRQTAGPVTNSLHDSKTKDTKRLNSQKEKSSSIERSKDDKPESVTDSDQNSSALSQQLPSGSTDIKELDENEALSVERGNVQKFQQRQKVIEEANKRKRALLAKAIDDRRKKAKAEAEKLMKVQQELNHLDSLLTADITIIRDKIEAASLEYMEAQKRYEKAEKEFVAAKMDLFSKCEAKEHLTEHLYTIIHQNEVRKAKKLVELMEKLSMEVTAEEMELTIPAIPQLTNFTAVSTLHDPHLVKIGPAVDSDKNDVISAPSIGEITRSENAVDTIEVVLSPNSADVPESNVSLEVTPDTAGQTSDTVSSESVRKDACTPGQQNGIFQNHAASESNLNNHPDTTSKTIPAATSKTTPAATSVTTPAATSETIPAVTSETTPVATLDKISAPQNCQPSSTPSEVKLETQIAESASCVDKLQELRNAQESILTHVESSSLTVEASPVSDGGKLEDAKSAESQASSSNASSGKGWMLPFS